MLRKKKLWSVVGIVALLLAVPVVQAASQAAYFLEPFNRVVYHQPGDPDVPYWVILNGDAGQYYGVPCSDASCVSAEKEKHTRFARLQIYPDQTPGNLTSSEISELRTGYSAGQGRWLPTAGHPVIVTARARFSGTYQPDGTGGAVGSFGMWLWNSYLDFTQPTPGQIPIEAFGFSWGEQGNWVGTLDGMQIAALQDNLPVYHERLTTLRPDQWQQWTLIWSVDRAGQQHVAYLLNRTVLGLTTLPRPYGALSLTFWNDNQFATVDPATGEFTVEYHQPTGAQNFDVDHVVIYQP